MFDSIGKKVPDFRGNGVEQPVPFHTYHELITCMSDLRCWSRSAIQYQGNSAKKDHHFEKK